MIFNLPTENEEQTAVLLLLFAAAAGLSALIGYRRGLFLTVFSFVCWFLSAAFAMWILPYLLPAAQSLLGREISGIGRYVLCLLLISVVSAVAHALARLINKGIRRVPIIGQLNRIGGLLFGLARAALLAAAVCLILQLLQSLPSY